MIMHSIKSIKRTDKGLGINNLKEITQTSIGTQVGRYSITKDVTVSECGKFDKSINVVKTFCTQDGSFFYADDGYVYKVDNGVERYSDRVYFDCPEVCDFLYKNQTVTAIIYGNLAEIVGTGNFISVPLGKDFCVCGERVFFYNGNDVCYSKGELLGTTESMKIGFIRFNFEHGKIVKLVSINNFLYVFFERGIFLINCNKVAGEYQPIAIKFSGGEIIGKTVRNVGTEIFFVCGESLMRVLGKTVKELVNLSEGRYVKSFGKAGRYRDKYILPIENYKGEKRLWIYSNNCDISLPYAENYLLKDGVMLSNAKKSILRITDEFGERVWTSKQLGGSNLPFVLSEISVYTEGVSELVVNDGNKDYRFNLLDGNNRKLLSIKCHELWLSLRGNGSNFEAKNLKINYRK